MGPFAALLSNSEVLFELCKAAESLKNPHYTHVEVLFCLSPAQHNDLSEKHKQIFPKKEIVGIFRHLHSRLPECTRLKTDALLNLKEQ